MVMRKPQDWYGLLNIEPAFLALEKQTREGSFFDYRQLSPESFAWHAWDLISEERLFEVMLPCLRQQLQRACEAMPALYASSLREINPGMIRCREDWWRVPILVKDDEPASGLRGFREIANTQPHAMRPADMPAASVPFGSGGSQGRTTPTYVSALDRAREIQGWRRGHDYHGLMPGDTALYTYNTTHKGGQWMQESLWTHGVNVLLRRPEEDAGRVLENLRDYQANTLFTVQQPYEIMQQPAPQQDVGQAKSIGINLHDLVRASLEEPKYRGILIPDAQGRKQVEFIFLGGFEIAPYARELIDEYLDHTPVATLLGSSEAIPQACSTNPNLTPGGTCHLNNLHLLHSPHYIEVVKRQGERWVPVEKGEQGLLVYTSWARDGTIWIRYAPGDVATRLLDEGECPCGLFSPVISDVHRQNASQLNDLFITGCAAG